MFDFEDSYRLKLATLFFSAGALALGKAGGAAVLAFFIGTFIFFGE